MMAGIVNGVFSVCVVSPDTVGEKLELRLGRPVADFAAANNMFTLDFLEENDIDVGASKLLAHLVQNKALIAGAEAFMDVVGENADLICRHINKNTEFRIQNTEAPRLYILSSGSWILYSENMFFKRPESVLVVVHTLHLEVLLLQRVMPPVGLWQSVTGSLEWHEDPPQAACREVYEETGNCLAAEPVSTGVVNRFDIVPESRHLYPPETIKNTEYVFTLALPERIPVRVNPAEHGAFIWLPAREAAEKTGSWSNREAILRLKKHY